MSYFDCPQCDFPQGLTVGYDYFMKLICICGQATLADGYTMLPEPMCLYTLVLMASQRGERKVFVTVSIVEGGTNYVDHNSFHEIHLPGETLFQDVWLFAGLRSTSSNLSKGMYALMVE